MSANKTYHHTSDRDYDDKPIDPASPQASRVFDLNAVRPELVAPNPQIENKVKKNKKYIKIKIYT